MEDIRFYGAAPYRIAGVHGGPGARGSLASLCGPLSERLKAGVAEPFQTKHTVSGLTAELGGQLARLDRPVLLVGHSWGAWLSLLLAADHPEQVSGIALVGCAPLEESYVPEIAARRRRNLSGPDARRFDALAAVLERGGAGDRDAALAELGKLAERSDSVDALPAPPAPPPDGDAYAAVWPEAAALRASGELLACVSRIRCPVLVLHGDRDPHPPAGVTEPLRRVGVPFEAEIFPTCGHSPHAERAVREKFFARLTAFCRNLC